jgi:uncharacterized membrane protein YqgA involved in biofilm formation
MLEATKKVMNEYRILVVKTTLDFVNNVLLRCFLNFYVTLRSYMG